MLNLLSQTSQAAGTVDGAVVNWDRNIPLNLQGRRTVRLYLGITGVTGSPTLDINLVKTVNGQEFVVGTVPQQTGVGNTTLVVADCPNNVFARATVGGTGGPTVTYNLDGEILE